MRRGGCEEGQKRACVLPAAFQAALSPRRALYFAHIVKQRFGLGDPDPAAVAEARRNFHTHADVLERHLHGRKWPVDDTLAVAGVSVAATLPYAEHTSMPLEQFPNVQRYHDQFNEIAAWRGPFPPPAGPSELTSQILVSTQASY